MESKFNVQEDLYGRIEKAHKNYKKSSKERLSSRSYLETRLQTLEETWKSFTTYHTSIIEEADSIVFTSNSYFVEDIYESCQELYTVYRCELLEAIDKIEQKQDRMVIAHDYLTENKHHPLKLPKICIPTFSGQYSEWIGFRDLFKSLVHNNSSLDNVQRLHYLKCHLSGEAEQLLRHIPITQENYALCWKQLKDRYDNKRYLTNCILRNFMSQKILTAESATALRGMLDCTNETLYALKTIGIDVNSWDVIIIYILSQKLDSESRKHWEVKLSESANELPKLNQFKDFLETRSRALEFIDPKLSKIKSQSYVTQVNQPNYNQLCIYCKDAHRLCHCKSFASNDVDTRRKLVQSNNLCFNCMGSGHSVYSCRHTSRCRICKKKHHTLLHPKTNHTADSQVAPATTAESGTEENSSSNVTACLSTSNTQVLLATALVKVKSRSGLLITLRCLLDQGSQASFITEAAVQLLGLKKTQHQSSIVGIGSDENNLIASRARVSLQIQALHNTDVQFSIQALVLSRLTSILPSRHVTMDTWSQFSDLTLADPAFDRPNKIDMLLGADIYGQILLDGVIKGPLGTPVAQNTKLGWILSGSAQVPNYESIKISCNMATDITENDFLKKFWEQESELSATKCLFTEEEAKCEQIFHSTTSRDNSGRYIVNLPFRDTDPKCQYGNSRNIAIKRFLQQERRLSRDPQLKEQYAEVIAEYLKLGHMELVPADQLDKSTAVYLPHHAVVREDKETTKVRVVFNASEVGSNGVALNDDLLVGPTLQDDLRHIIMRWRGFPICLIADIVKMYRQVKINKEHVDYQRLIWRDRQDQELQHLRLLRLTFGTASAPYLAVRALHQLANDDGKTYPSVSEKIMKDFYMDDLMTGCETVEEGKEIYRDATRLLQGGGFELQKWSSNNLDLLREISNGETQTNLKIKLDNYMKTLGLTWNRNTDTFEFAVTLPAITKPITKRKVISDISRLFDPLGWLAPVMIKAKIFIQKLWLSGIEWDEELPPQLLIEWINYRNKLTQLTNFKLPRWINTKSTDRLQELQGFADASSDGFAAVVYLRIVDQCGVVHVRLVTSKTKVAPIKQISIPKLELCGAVLLTKLLIEVAEVLKVKAQNIHAWTDSAIVLAWINSRPNRWKTYVANRVTEIITAVEPHQWSHVSSKDNPADCASRGTSELEGEELWKEGPAWLKETDINYKIINRTDTKLEEKPHKQCFASAYPSHQDDRFSASLFSKFSSFTRLIRVVAYIKRWVRKFKKNPIYSWLERQDIQEGLKACIKLCQAEEFLTEITNLRGNTDINKKSKLISLSPFLDVDGILRVGGRLRNANMTEQSKHPIILPHKSPFSDLLIAEAHVRTLHGGPQLMLNYLRTKYWIIGAKQLVKAFVRKCVTCLRQSAKTRNQLMGQLPTVRATASRPFINSGVDYAGPINVRTSKGRGHHAQKGYICLFVCMATRAIHLELVSDLTTQGFLAAFKRFVARRGICENLWSDNGTNFVGAARELKSLYMLEKESIAVEIAEQLAVNGTSWHFIPPHSPNFGGLWEAGVKSTKYHLKRVIGTSTLTFEELTTIITQIEACLNSRPISKICSDASEPVPLTPSHFLVGESLIVAPDINYQNSSVGILRRWQLTQKMVQDFWRRWSLEYLTQFYHRYKWAYQKPEPEIGDIVLVMEDDLPPSRWLYGIITEKHIGTDKLTRVVSLKCKGSIIKRPVSKLCFLPIVQ